MINKRLTADEVARKKFTPVRLREGYSMDEVDAFLDVVQASLASNESEIKDLQKSVKAEAAKNAGPEIFPGSSPGAHAFADSPGVPAQLPPSPANDQAVKQLQSELENALSALESAQGRIDSLEVELSQAKHEAANAVALPSPSAPPGEDPIQASAASAARMLEMASRQHDELLAQGQAESKKLLSNAQGQAEEMLSHAREQAEVERRRVEEERDRQLGNLAEEKAELENALEALRRLEEDSRAKLTAHFTEKLEEVKSSILSDLPPAPRRRAESVETIDSGSVDSEPETSSLPSLEYGSSMNHDALDAPLEDLDLPEVTEAQVESELLVDPEVEEVIEEAVVEAEKEPEELRAKDLNSYPSFFNG